MEQLNHLYEKNASLEADLSQLSEDKKELEDKIKVLQPQIGDLNLKYRLDTGDLRAQIKKLEANTDTHDNQP